MVISTGRTHQIRVHLSHKGHSVLADALYGRGDKTRLTTLSPALAECVAGLTRQALHARLLGFHHPITGKAMQFEAPLPADLHVLHDTLKNHP